LLSVTASNLFYSESETYS